MIDCPRCKGFGSTIQDKGDYCLLCDGDGKLEIVDKGKGQYKKVDSEKIIYF